MPKVTFSFDGDRRIVVNAAEGERLLAVAKRSGVNIDAPCNGNGTCGKCRVKLMAGAAEMETRNHITPDEYAEGWRLACDTFVTEDITVYVPASASAFKRGIKTADLRDPATRKVFEEVAEHLAGDGLLNEKAVFVRSYELTAPSLADAFSDSDRLASAVNAEFGEEVKISLNAIRKLAYILRENDFRVKTVLAKEDGVVRVLDVLAPGEESPVCGVAIDIGTTTVTAVMVNMESGEILSRASAGNGQITYGADIINRIIESVKPGGADRLYNAVAKDTIDPLIGEMCAQAGVTKEHIYRMVVAGNTTMEHLLLKLFADPVRMEPYVPSFFKIDRIQAEDVFEGINLSAGLNLAPNVGSYVGGDITAGILSSEIWNSEKTTLFIDLGTNGEIVLGNKEYLMCCACSAGPAFEGGEMSCGMRATDGAIDSVRIDKESMEPAFTVIGGGTPTGICGSGIIDAVAQMLLAGIVSPKGHIIREGERVKKDEHGMSRYILAFADEVSGVKEVSINEVDIDNFMRAKAAIFSAVMLMIGQLGIEAADIEEIQIAGGIGSGIDFANAITIGMFPDIDRSRFRYIGNSSLSGAYAMLLSDAAKEKVDEIASSMMYIELSSEPGYMDEFVAACFMPHTDASLFPSVVL